MQKNKIVSIASGKGGVGKTLTTVHLAMAARRMKQRVLIIDGDFGMANVDVVLGLRPRYNINDVLYGNVRLNEIVLQGPLGVGVVPTGSGIETLANLSLSQRVGILDQFEELSSAYDVVVIDTGAGISHTVLHLNSIADEIIVVTTPEPHSMTDAYAFIKVMVEKYKVSKINLLINQSVNKDQGLKIASRITEVARRFLDIEIKTIGVVPLDDTVTRTVMNQTTGDEGLAKTLSGQAWNEIALNLFESIEASSKKSWESLVFPLDNGYIRI